MKKPFHMTILLAVLAAAALLSSCAVPAAKPLVQTVSVAPAPGSTANTAGTDPSSAAVASSAPAVVLPAPPPAPAPEPLGPYDVSVSIQYRITLDDKAKDTDPNIIRAARQGMFDYDANNAHHAHYAGYSVSYDIDLRGRSKGRKYLGSALP